MKKLLAILITACFFLNSIPVTFAQNEDSLKFVTYGDYIGEEAIPANKTVVLTGENTTYPLSQRLGETGVYLEEEKEALWLADIPEEGYYNIEIKYISTEGKNIESELALKINGQIPFDRCEQFPFHKVYKDDGEIISDRKGDDIRPKSVQIEALQYKLLTDPLGYKKEPLLFHFNKGENSIALKAVKDSIFVVDIIIFGFQPPADYANYLQETGGKDSKGYYKEIAAQKPFLKSSPVIFAVSDRSSPLVLPSSAKNIRLNAMGGATWSEPGQWIAYGFEVYEDGYYHIAIKAKQNLASGIKSYRKIYIDDEIPFREMESIGFAFSAKWQQTVLGGEIPYKIYLKKGTHTVKIENVLGEYAAIVGKAEETVVSLNEAYRESIMYMGVSPDQYRDYMVEINLPGVIGTFRDCAENLALISEEMSRINKKGDRSAMIDKLKFQLESIIKLPETLPKRLDALKSNIGALSAFVIDIRNQPLTLDYITVFSPGGEVKPANGNVIENTVFTLKNFVATFFVDYSLIGGVSDSEKTVKAWVVTGRDQANVIKRLINTSFSRDSGIEVNLQLVQQDMVIPAIAGGIGPDIVMQMPNTEPVNYGMRGAVYDISRFDDCKEIEKRFSNSALTPLRYQNGLYGLPETESFMMLFYRKDILKELDIKVPDNWDEAVSAISVLERNNMQFGLQKGSGSYGIFLYQFGGDFYKKDSFLTDLTSENAMKAFEFYTGLYADYKIPMEFDFVTRFRMGEMPLGIVDYSFYNNLQVAAPEIRGLWDFAPVPGTKKEDATVDRSVLSYGNSAFILKETKEPEAAWEFLKWWTGAANQTSYANEIETILGSSARYPAANLEAFSQIPWKRQDYDRITLQRQSVKGVPSVPGGYFLFRHLDNAFRKTVLTMADPREVMEEYSRMIDDEIKIKCDEFMNKAS